MFIGIATRDLGDIQVCDRVISFKKDARFYAQDGVLYEQIKAGNIRVLAQSDRIKNDSIEGFIEFENDGNRTDMETLINLGDGEAYRDMRFQVNDLKDENYKLKKELEELKKNSSNSLEVKDTKTEKRKKEKANIYAN